MGERFDCEERVMAYESPISVWWSDTRIEQLRDEYDNLIVRAVKNVCPQVDKDELIKALEYDRGQYEKGFADGLSFKPPVKSNADRIRAMSDEELAWLFVTGCEGRKFPRCAVFTKSEEEATAHCKECWAKWLRKGVDE